MYINESPKMKRSLGNLRKATKTKPKSPDLTGQMRLQRHTAVALVKQFRDDDDGEIVANIAAWRNYDHCGAYLTIELSPRFVASMPNDQEDVIDFIINEQQEEHN